MHYAVTPWKEPILPWQSEMEKPQGFVLAGMLFTSVKASDRQEASLDSRSDLRKGTLTKQ